MGTVRTTGEEPRDLREKSIAFETFRETCISIVKIGHEIKKRR